MIASSDGRRSETALQERYEYKPHSGRTEDRKQGFMHDPTLPFFQDWLQTLSEDQLSGISIARLSTTVEAYFCRRLRSSRSSFATDPLAPALLRHASANATNRRRTTKTSSLHLGARRIGIPGGNTLALATARGSFSKGAERSVPLRFAFTLAPGLRPQLVDA